MYLSLCVSRHEYIRLTNDSLLKDFTFLNEDSSCTSLYVWVQSFASLNTYQATYIRKAFSAVFLLKYVYYQHYKLS